MTSSTSSSARPTSSGRREPIISTSIGVETSFESLSSTGTRSCRRHPRPLSAVPVNSRLIAGGAISPGSPRVFRAMRRHARAGGPVADQRDGVKPPAERDRATGREAETVDGRAEGVVSKLSKGHRAWLSLSMSPPTGSGVPSRTPDPVSPGLRRQSSDALAEALDERVERWTASSGRLREEAGNAVRVLVSGHGFAPRTLAPDLRRDPRRAGVPRHADPAADLARALRQWRPIDSVVSSRLGQWLRPGSRRPCGRRMASNSCSSVTGGGSRSTSTDESQKASSIDPHTTVRERRSGTRSSHRRPELGSQQPGCDAIGGHLQGRFATEALT